jgi:hypothetical protein
MTCSTCHSMETELWCRECDKSYCSPCYELVHTASILKTHVSIPIDQRRMMLVSCDQHPDGKRQFWCDTCSTLVCPNCVIVQHQGHTCTGIEIEAPHKAKEVWFQFFFSRIPWKNICFTHIATRLVYKSEDNFG